MLVVLIISDDDVVCHSYSDFLNSQLKGSPLKIFHHLTCVRWISFYYSLQALKTKHDTPKYGLIYHAQLVGQASAKLKGKVSL